MKKIILLILITIITISNGFSKNHKVRKINGDKRTYAIAMPLVTISFIVFLVPCAIKIK